MVYLQTMKNTWHICNKLQHWAVVMPRRKLAIYISSEKNYHRIFLMLVSGSKKQLHKVILPHISIWEGCIRMVTALREIWKKPGFIYLMRQKVE